jgi:hypothetical protein
LKKDDLILHDNPESFIGFLNVLGNEENYDIDDQNNVVDDKQAITEDEDDQKHELRRIDADDDNEDYQR